MKEEKKNPSTFVVGWNNFASDDLYLQFLLLSIQSAKTYYGLMNGTSSNIMYERLIVNITVN